MGSQVSEDLGKLIMRLALGVLVLLHGLAKIVGGVSGIAGMLSGAGLPEGLAYGVYLGEVLGPLLLILGWHARVGAALVAINMLVAFGLAHLGQLALLNNSGGWQLELQGMFLFTAIALMLIGPGRISLNGR
jgi:putative oxidoreductase